MNLSLVTFEIYKDFCMAAEICQWPMFSVAWFGHWK